jgi:co-chaperonin GroES (HSP10)
MKELLEPLGPRIKIKVDAPKEERSAGGIIYQMEDNPEDNETGVVVALGEQAFGNFSKNWVEVGDKVLFQRYAGKPREEVNEDGSVTYYRILKDVDVIGRYKQVTQE